MYVNDKRISPEYRRHLQSDYWHEVRERVLLRDTKCMMCGSTENLEIHHMNGRYRFHEREHPETLICLCQECHSWIHRYWNTCDEIKAFYAEKAHKENMARGYY